MPPLSRQSEAQTAVARSATKDRAERVEWGARSRIFLVAVSTVASASSWFVVRVLAARLFSEAVSGLAAFVAGWIALYPLSRLNRSVPAWAHWARGAFVLVVIWIMMMFVRRA